MLKADEGQKDKESVPRCPAQRTKEKRSGKSQSSDACTRAWERKKKFRFFTSVLHSVEFIATCNGFMGPREAVAKAGRASLARCHCRLPASHGLLRV